MSNNTNTNNVANTTIDNNKEEITMKKTYELRLYTASDNTIEIIKHGRCELFDLIIANGGSTLDDIIAINVHRVKPDGENYDEYVQDAVKANYKLYNEILMKGYRLFAYTSASKKEGTAYFLKTKFFELCTKRSMMGGTLPAEYNTNKFLIQNGLMFTTSTPTIEKFGFDIEPERIAICDDVEVELPPRKVLKISYDSTIREIMMKLSQKITDGIVIRIIEDYDIETCFTIRGGSFKGLVVSVRRSGVAKLIKLLKGHEYLVDIWNNKLNLNDIDLIVFKSSFKHNKFFSSREQFVDGWKANDVQLRAALINDNHAKKALPYQQAQTLIMSEEDKKAVYEMIKADLDAAADKAKAPGMMGKIIADKINKYPELLGSPAMRAAINDVYAKRKLAATGGRIPNVVKYEFLAPDVVAILSALFCDKTTPLLKDNECLYQSTKDKLVSVTRCPHLLNDHLTFKNLAESDMLFDGLFVHKNVFYINVMCDAYTRLMFDYDGDKLAVVVNNTIKNIVRKQPIETLVIWDAPEGNPESVTSATIAREFAQLFSSVNIGQFCFSLNKVYAYGIDNMQFKAYLKMMANIAIDAAKNKNVKVEEPEGLRDMMKVLKQPLYVRDAKLFKDSNYEVDPDKFELNENSWLDVHCDNIRKNTADAVYDDINTDTADFTGFLPDSWSLVPDFANYKKEDKEAGLFLRIAAMSENELISFLGEWDYESDGKTDIRVALKEQIKAKLAAHIAQYKNKYTGEQKTWEDGFCTVSQRLLGSIGMDKSNKLSITDSKRVWLLKPVWELYFIVYEEEFAAHMEQMAHRTETAPVQMSVDELLEMFGCYDEDNGLDEE